MNTKEKPSTQATPGEIARQIADKTASEIADLEARLTIIQQEGTQLRQEREQIVRAQTLRADHLLSLQNNVIRLDQKHRDAVSYASVAQGTLGEQDAVRQVNEHLSMLKLARADVERVSAPYSEQNQHATARLAEIDAELERMSHEAQQARERWTEVARVRDRAVGELGDHTYQSLLAEYQGHQERIEALRQQIVELQVQKIQFLDQAQETLSLWPELARNFKNEEPYDDATARVLQAARDYVERLIEDGPNITHAMNVPATSYAAGNNWLVLLEVPRHDLFINEHVSYGRNHKGLAHRLNVLNALLSQYVASKR